MDELKTRHETATKHLISINCNIKVCLEENKQISVIITNIPGVNVPKTHMKKQHYVIDFSSLEVYQPATPTGFSYTSYESHL